MSKRLTELARDNPRRKLKKIKVVRKRPLRKKILKPTPTAAAIPEVVSVEHVVHLGPVTPSADPELNPLVPTIPLPKEAGIPAATPLPALLNPAIPAAPVLQHQKLLVLDHPAGQSIQAAVPGQQPAMLRASPVITAAQITTVPLIPAPAPRALPVPNLASSAQRALPVPNLISGTAELSSPVVSAHLTPVVTAPVVHPNVHPAPVVGAHFTPLVAAPRVHPKVHPVPVLSAHSTPVVGPSAGVPLTTGLPVIGNIGPKLETPLTTGLLRQSDDRRYNYGYK